jgi:hypothetical protein
MFKSGMFCFAENNKIISGIENTDTKLDWKKKPDFQHTSGCQGC